jgi:serine/threonine protein kinase
MIHICEQLREQVEREEQPSQDNPNDSHLSHPPPDPLKPATQSAVFRQEHKLGRDNWHRLPLDLCLSRLRAFFLCLCKALEYIHEQGVRHKDIKPQNILIDGSLSPILADFGLSAQFPHGESHVTHDGPPGTREYTAPETVPSKGGPISDHDDDSDVFSLGCVFLEVAAVSLGEDLSEFRKKRRDPAFYSDNLAFVDEWIQQRVDKQVGTGLFKQAHVLQDSREAILQVLPTIRLMMRKDPKERPKSRKLAGTSELAVDFSEVSSWICPDCSGDNPWTPSTEQQQAQTLRLLPTIVEQKSQESEPPVSLANGSGRLDATDRRPISSAASISSTNSEMQAAELKPAAKEKHRSVKPGEKVYIYRRKPFWHEIVEFQQIQS